MSAATKYWLDFLSFGAALSAFAGWLSPIIALIAASLSVVWLSIQIYDWFKHGRIDKD